MPTPNKPLIVRPSTKLLAFQYMIANLFLLAAIFTRLKFDSSYLTYALALFWGVLTMWTAVTHISFHYTTLTLRDDSLVYETGVLNRSSRSLNLQKVQDIRVDQNLGDRIFNLGNITLETAGENGSLFMQGIDRPRQVADEILARARGQSTA